MLIVLSNDINILFRSSFLLRGYWCVGNKYNVLLARVLELLLGIRAIYLFTSLLQKLLQELNNEGVRVNHILNKVYRDDKTSNGVSVC